MILHGIYKLLVEKLAFPFSMMNIFVKTAGLYISIWPIRSSLVREFGAKSYFECPHFREKDGISREEDLSIIQVFLETYI